MSGTSDLETYLLGQTQAVGATPANTQTAVRNFLFTEFIQVQKPGAATTGDDASASTDVTDYVIWSNDTGGQCTVKGITFRPGNTGFTESTSVFSTMTITKRTSAGASSTTVATATTNTVANGGLGTMTTGQTGQFTLTATIADRVIPAGGCLLYSKTHASSGTVIPGGMITIQVHMEG